LLKVRLVDVVSCIHLGTVFYTLEQTRSENPRLVRQTDNCLLCHGSSQNQEMPGPRDGKGRSLRDLDLERRLFRYPCSYLIYSPAFDALPGEVKEHIYRRLWEVLTGRDTGKEFSRLSADDRKNIWEILTATKPGLPDYWRLK